MTDKVVTKSKTQSQLCKHDTCFRLTVDHWTSEFEIVTLFLLGFLVDGIAKIKVTVNSTDNRHFDVAVTPELKWWWYTEGHAQIHVNDWTDADNFAIIYTDVTVFFENLTSKIAKILPVLERRFKQRCNGEKISFQWLILFIFERFELLKK